MNLLPLEFIGWFFSFLFGGKNENPSPAFVQAMSELEEINKALDEVMKRLQEEKQVKNDNVT